MRISDWSSDVCSSDLDGNCATSALIGRELSFAVREIVANAVRHAGATMVNFALEPDGNRIALQVSDDGVPNMARLGSSGAVPSRRSEEHTSELQSLMRISYAVFCLKKKITLYTAYV